MDYLAAASDRAVEDVGNEQRGIVSAVGGSHIPGAIDLLAGESFHDLATVVEHQQTSRLRGL